MDFLKKNRFDSWIKLFFFFFASLGNLIVVVCDLFIIFIVCFWHLFIIFIKIILYLLKFKTNFRIWELVKILIMLLA